MPATRYPLPATCYLLPATATCYLLPATYLPTCACHVAARYDALLKALWSPATDGSISAPPGAVGATINVERVVRLLAQQEEQQEAAAAAAAGGGNSSSGNSVPASQVRALSVHTWLRADTTPSWLRHAVLRCVLRAAG